VLGTRPLPREGRRAPRVHVPLPRLDWLHNVADAATACRGVGPSVTWARHPERRGSNGS
jgi:hypothetical protein